MEKRSSLLRIGKPKEVLNKHQKEFNRLTETLEILSAELADLKSALELLRFRFFTEQNPLISEYQSLQIDLLYLFIRADSSDYVNRSHKAKLARQIAHISAGVRTHERFDELRPFVEKYLPEDFEALQVTLNDQTKTTSKLAITQEAVSTRDFHLLSDEERQQIKEANRRHKQKEREESIAEQSEASRSVRKVYAQLAKMFHPDFAADESEQLERTKKMQHITEAYHKDDLMALLHIQFEMESGKNWRPELLGKEQLMYYNRVLRDQIGDLEGEKEEIQQNLSAFTYLLPEGIQSATIAIMQFNTVKNELKAAIRELKQTLIALRTPGNVNVFLAGSK